MAIAPMSTLMMRGDGCRDGDSRIGAPVTIPIGGIRRTDGAAYGLFLLRLTCSQAISDLAVL